jgi:hypothetical protein
MAESSARTIGLPWYCRADYQSVRSMMTDQHSLAPTYDLWLIAAENNESVAQQAGLHVERVIIRPDEFAQWCHERRMALDSSARVQFAKQMAQAAP